MAMQDPMQGPPPGQMQDARKGMREELDKQAGDYDPAKCVADAIDSAGELVAHLAKAQEALGPPAEAAPKPPAGPPPGAEGAPLE